MTRIYSVTATPHTNLYTYIVVLRPQISSCFPRRTDSLWPQVVLGRIRVLFGYISIGVLRDTS